MRAFLSTAAIAIPRRRKANAPKKKVKKRCFHDLRLSVVNYKRLATIPSSLMVATQDLLAFCAIKQFVVIYKGMRLSLSRVQSVS